MDPNALTWPGPCSWALTVWWTWEAAPTRSTVYLFHKTGSFDVRETDSTSMGIFFNSFRSVRGIFLALAR